MRGGSQYMYLRVVDIRGFTEKKVHRKAGYIIGFIKNTDSLSSPVFWGSERRTSMGREQDTIYIFRGYDSESKKKLASF